MPAAPNLLCHYVSGSVTLAAATATPKTFPTGGARVVTVVVKNTGSTNNITAISYKVAPLANLYGADTAISSGLPITPGNSLRFSIVDEAASEAKVTVTSTSGTTCQIEAGGR